MTEKDDQKSKRREEVDDKYKWNLSLIYIDDKSLNTDISKIKELTEKLMSYEGHIMDNASTLYEANALLNEIMRTFEKVYVYANMKFHEDMSISKNQRLVGKIDKLNDDISSKIAFFSPEVLASNFDIVKKYAKEDKRLQQSLFSFESLFRNKGHVLDKTVESMLASLGGVFSVSRDTFDMLDNVDLTFDDIVIDNKRLPLNQSNYSIYIKDSNRDIRYQAFLNMHKSYKDHINTFASLYNGNIKADNFISKIRNYFSCLDMELYDDNIDEKLYDKLINSVHKSFPILDKYLNLKKQVLKVSSLHMYDLYVPLVSEVTKKYTYEEAKNLVLKALQPLGETYINDLKGLFDSRCIDVYYNNNKKGGAYSWGSYDTLPYVLLNFEGTFNDVSTIAHELGHSMHSNYSHKNNSYEDSAYPIFLAEIASTINEIFLNRYCATNATTKKEKLFYLNNLLESIRTTLYRQTLFAEFEKIVHDEEMKGEVLDQESLSKIYYDLNKEYYNNMEVDEEIKYEWARIPHFYTSYYVYKYATGISVALCIVNNILNNKDNALDNYLTLLKSGGSNYPLEILKKCGIDIVNDDTIDKALEVFKNTIDEFEKVLNS